MKKSVKQFFLRGMLFGGFGPIIAGIVYYVLSLSLSNFSLSGAEVLLAIISTYVLAFVQAGASVFNQMESWSLAKSIAIHFLTIYLAYVVCYVINSWIPFRWEVILIFTAIFAIAYFVIWLTVYLLHKRLSNNLNKKLK